MDHKVTFGDAKHAVTSLCTVYEPNPSVHSELHRFTVLLPAALLQAASGHQCCYKLDLKTQ